MEERSLLFQIGPIWFDGTIIIMTLLTCTPYMVNSHRLLVRGHRTEYVEAIQEKEIRENQLGGNYQELFFIAAAGLVVVLSLVGAKMYLSKK